MEEIAKQAITRYSQDGIVSLSFGLLLIALLYDAWSSRKQSAKDRETYTEHVLRFAGVMADNTEVMRRSTEALEDMTGEVRTMAGAIEKLGDRVGHLERRPL